MHRGRTSEGAEVAVKVLRPGIEESFARDLAALELFARVAESLSAEARRLRFIAIKQTWRPRWRWNWICGWRPPALRNSMSARAARAIFASRTSIGSAPRPGC